MEIRYLNRRNCRPNPNPNPNLKTFPRSYVEELRWDADEARVKTQRSDTLRAPVRRPQLRWAAWQTPRTSRSTTPTWLTP